MTDDAEKNKRMLDFWTERALKFKGDPRANTPDIWIREIEIEAVSKNIRENPASCVLDFGCANGYSTIRIAQKFPDIQFVGVDINSHMIALAKEIAGNECDNVSFLQMDICEEDIPQKFDFVYAIRALQNLESLDKQKKIFDRLLEMMTSHGLFYFIESYEDGYEQLNADRKKMGLPLLPIHPHLTLLTDEFDNYVGSKMDLVERGWPTSSYYHTTRLVYSYIAQQSGKPIDYNHPIHQVSAMAPQMGKYGPQKSGLYRKR